MRNFIILALSIISLNSVSAQSGCTNPSACNYEPLALVDDGTCTSDLVWFIPATPSTEINGQTPAILACESPLGYILADPCCIEEVLASDAYCINITWDQTCQGAYTACQAANSGCNNPEACNYDPCARVNDGSCTNLLQWYIPEVVQNLSGMAAVYTCFDVPEGYILGDQAAVESIVLGDSYCLTNTWDPSCQLAYEELTYIGTLGCTQPSACNYNFLAETDDGSCVSGNWYVPGVLYENGEDSGALINTQGFPIYACFPPLYFYELANECALQKTADDNGVLISELYFQTNIENPVFVYGNACCPLSGPEFRPNDQYRSYLYKTNSMGCPDPLACNYHENYCVEEPCYYSNWVLNEEGFVVQICKLFVSTYASIHNQVIIEDLDNCCIEKLIDDGCLVNSGGLYEAYVWTEVCEEAYRVCQNFASGCTDPLACNFNPDTCIDDGNCTYPGCTHTLAINFNPFAGCSDSSCDFIGCSNYLAINYSPLVTIPNNNSCIFTGGCTYELATNYDTQALTDDGSCIIELDDNQCAGDFDNNGAVTALDLSIFLSIFGTVCGN